jgi:DNA-binding NtrC family response regulator
LASGLTRAHAEPHPATRAGPLRSAILALSSVASRVAKSRVSQYCATIQVLHCVFVVDDDESLCRIMRSLLEHEGFDITVAGNVTEALKLISSERYDVLLSDLHMPGAADGLTVISAMRHVNPKTISLLLTSFPKLDVAAKAILRQADEILLKDSDFKKPIESIKHRIANGTCPAGRP